MAIIACGINHKTAPIALREKVVFSPEKIALYLQDLMQSESVSEAVLLSTCNRSELYCETNHPERLLAWFCRQQNLKLAELAPVFYLHQESDAIRHIIEVACGLDSMVLGESQILGQMKTAFSESCAAGMVGPLFNRLFQQVFAVAKEIRTNTSIGACPVSVSSAAVRFVQQKNTLPFKQANVVLLGAGLTIELVLRHLIPLAPKNITIINRSEASALALREKNSAKKIATLTFEHLPRVLTDADIVISATGSAQPVVTKDMLAARAKNILLVDIAVPRDIDPLVAEFPQVALFSIDDLRDIIQQNLKNREHAADKAREVVLQRCEDFIDWQNSIDLVSSTIRAWRGQMENLCQTELTKALNQLQRGEDPSVVMQMFSRTLMQKILHTPSVQLREAGVAGRTDLLQLARELFAIPERQIKFS